jgi:hypothetical protein
MRLNQSLAPTLVESLRRDFADIFTTGELVQTSALPDEREQEPELDHLPRLVCRLAHGRAGRLRQLIDRVNSEG